MMAESKLENLGSRINAIVTCTNSRNKASFRRLASCGSYVLGNEIADGIAFAGPTKTSPDPISLCTDYMLRRPGKLYCRIHDTYSGFLHLESIFQCPSLANME